LKRPVVWVLVVVSVFALAACARSSLQVQWEAALDLANAEADVAALDALAASAPRQVDAAQARLDAARTLRDGGRLAAAAKRFMAIGDEASRIADRARGRYELARLAEDTGRETQAVSLYRSLVLTYPRLMPGERALQHLLRLARAAGPEAVGAHLRWTRGVFPRLAETSLGDNLIFQAAEVAAERFARTQKAADWDLAVLLFQRVAREYPRGALWDDAHWELSWLYHDRQLYDAEINEIETIRLRREAVSFFGQDEHPYFYVGQRRLARLSLVHLHDPIRARDAWRSYAATWTRSIYRDDAWFFAGCAALLAGDEAGARADFAAIVEHRPESRFIRRTEAALADPTGPHCMPPKEHR